MAEAQPQATPQAPATQAAPEVTQSPLEKVYKDFNIEETAQSFKPETPQAPAAQPQPLKPADPFDPNFGHQFAKQAQDVTVLHQAVNDAVGRVSNLEKSLIARQTEADIKDAVGVIAEKAGIDPDVAEVAMEVKARKDPKFLAIWNNRHKNAKAWSAAQAALAMEVQQKYTVRQDPQLAENQRAVKVSQQQMATTTKTSETDELASMKPGERQEYLRRRFVSGK